MRAAESRTAKSEMFLRTGLQTSGSARWSSTVTIQNLKNVQSVSFWHGAADARLSQADRMEISMPRIRSVGRRYQHDTGKDESSCFK